MKKEHLVISETVTSTFHYHLRDTSNRNKFEAICGKTIGWDTKIPVSTWNLVTHLHEVYCEACNNIAQTELINFP